MIPPQLLMGWLWRSWLSHTVSRTLSGRLSLKGKRHLRASLPFLTHDLLLHIVRHLSSDDSLSFSLACRGFNAVRIQAGRQLRTRPLSTLRTEPLRQWGASLGCPPPFPHWAEVRCLGERSRCTLDGDLVLVMGPPNVFCRQRVRPSASLSSPAMLRWNRRRRASPTSERSCPDRRTREPTKDDPCWEIEAGEIRRKSIYATPSHVYALQAEELGKALIMHFQGASALEDLRPGQRLPLTGPQAASRPRWRREVEERARFVTEMHTICHNENCESSTAEEAGTSPLVLCMVGKGQIGRDGFSSPSMRGVEVHVEWSTSVEVSGPSTTHLTLIGGRPFEILELEDEQLPFAPFSGPFDALRARIRWQTHVVDEQSPVSNQVLCRREPDFL
ncbi:hypothetical protein CYMTET_33402 [Cymbomonas tetramitiformis]|uniref:F-box domain-containing protein n=1 Tax=Cymbomonas tetramitiformis TaxID=36881 RepID=A0AAE0FD75_9CHLO|nr:hypothetical protein CYMTET_33402 [Cymbomonas tetramitiformis]